MAWSAPRVWAVGEVVTAQNMNTYLSDEVEYLKGLAGEVEIEDSVIIDQGAGDDAIIEWHSSDVAHDFTVPAAPTCFGDIIKTSPTAGGYGMRGYSKGTPYAAGIIGAVDTPSDVRSTAGRAAVEMWGCGIAANDFATIGADMNMLAVRDNATTRFILDSDGDSHQDVGTAWTTFDDADDLALLTQLAVQVARPADPIRTRLAEWLNSNRQELTRLKLVSFNEDGHHFVNMSRLTMLLVGAVRQIGERHASVERRLAYIERALAVV